jgi:hypothetical protein
LHPSHNLCEETLSKAIGSGLLSAEPHRELTLNDDDFLSLLLGLLVERIERGFLKLVLQLIDRSLQCLHCLRMQHGVLQSSKLQLLLRFLETSNAHLKFSSTRFEGVRLSLQMQKCTLLCLQAESNPA